MADAKTIADLFTRERSVIASNAENLRIAGSDKPVKSLASCKYIKWQEETRALLKILALNNREIAQGTFCDADEVFAELDKADH
ncbi:prevent-host-death protein [Glaciimonas sp. PCH181]|uniref:prevent-host-death protein n=1 Tax=Glaciimonas sp. PCH181 TaxID=2133943 RepID=UPI000D39DA72|nr:prevent-host-death protein [Glaciimonas sp. PCH181]PUA17474.1 prevent-host-death protein [Glaciimonas sp. PCH181]